ncbi:TPA: hypothetical protein EYM82_25155 [Candidatus Poribacteria bacterium]|nr:hypothetical protein [Candidatus Poribacteria bacterium]
MFVDDISHGKVIPQHNARPGLRPYIHPLSLAGGSVCLTEDSPWHHPWQHGIQTGFHGVNGCDFWLDPGQHPDLPIGTIEPNSPRISGATPSSWTIEATWWHTDGSLLLVEQQIWSLSVVGEHLFLDLDWLLQAIPDIHIEQHAYGGLFIRMPFRRDYGASVFNSAGHQGDDTEQQAAAWVNLHMPIEDSHVGGGIAVLDHPTNPGHPVKWRVDGQRGINPAPCIPSPIELPAGSAIHYCYRLILHSAPMSFDQVDELWLRYAQQ